MLTEDAPADDDVAGRHGDGARPARHRQPAVRSGPALRRELGGEPPVAAWPASSPGWCTSSCRRENAEALAKSLQGLENSSGLKLVIAKSDSSQAPAGLRGIDLELVGDDRVGIVSNLTRILAEPGISIEHIHTEIVGTTPTAPKIFKFVAHAAGAEQPLVGRAASSAPAAGQRDEGRHRPRGQRRQPPT